MGETIKVDVLVTDNGSTAQATNNAKTLNTELQKVQRTASQTSAALKAAARPSGAMSQAQDDDMTSYRTARGIGGSTGAEGRDFSRQAQGLGGLVHVYATFAANLFAVSAAFTALSKAADTTNMIKGLDQLGAASGRALGSVAQNITKLTDGAISLKDAMQATAQATAGGMTSRQIERMAIVAKNASQALGRDMSDALSRLSRGIVKIEPELLDELGIMTRVDRAAQDYARSLGKTVISLTDFEKRQAFATAVLAEGEKKFNSINLDANPYSKLLASFSNLAISGGELLNKVLGPVAKLLAESPTALSAVIGGLSMMLLNRAIPAIGAWREGLVKSAVEAAKAAKAAKEMHETFAINRDLSRVESIVGPMKAQVSKGVAELQTVLGEALGNKSRLVKTAFSDTFNLEKEIPKYQALATRFSNELEAAKVAASDQNLTAAQRNIAAKEVQVLMDKKKSMEEAHKLAIDTLAVQKATTAELEKQHTKLEQSKGTKEEQGMVKRAAMLEQKAARAQVLANVGYNTQVMGMADAWKRLNQEINGSRFDDVGNKLDGAAAKLTGLSKATALASGGIRILATGITNIAYAFSNVFMVVGIAIAVFTTLDTLLTTNEKELDKFSEALKRTNVSADNASRTLSTLNSKVGLEALNAESFQARANAMNEVNDSLKEQVISFEAVAKSSGVWVKTIDNFKRIWGGDLQSKTIESFSKALSKGVEVAANGPAKEELKGKLKELLGGDDLTETGISKALEKLKKDAFFTPELKEKLLELGGAFSKLNQDANNAASSLSALQEVFKNAAKDRENMYNSMIPNDALSKNAMNWMSIGNAIRNASKSASEGVAAFTTMVQDINQLKTLPLEHATLLITKYRDRLVDISNKSIHITGSIESIKKAIKDNQASQDTMKFLDTPYSRVELDKLRAQESNQRASLADYEEKQRKLFIEEETLNKELSKDMSDVFAKGAQEFGKAYDAAVARSNIATQQHIFGLVSKNAGVSGNADVEANLAAKDIALQQRMLESQAQLILSNEKLKLVIEKDTISRDLATLEATKPDASDKQATAVYSIKRESLIQSQTSVDKAYNTLNGIKSISAIFKELSTVMASTDASAAGVQSRLMGAHQVIQGAAIKVAELSASLQKAFATRDFKRLDEKYNEEKALNDKVIERSQLVKGLVNDIAQLGPAYAVQTAQLQASLDKEISISKEKNIQANIDRLSGQARLIQDDKSLSSLVKEQSLKNISKNISEEIEKKSALSIESTITANKAALVIKQQELNVLKEELDIVNSIAKARKSVQDAKADLAGKHLENRKSLNEITPEDYITEKATIDSNKLMADYELQKDLLNASHKLELANLDIKKEQLSITLLMAEAMASTLPESSKAMVMEQLNNIREKALETENSLRDSILEKQNEELSALQQSIMYKQQGIEADERANLELERRSRLLTNLDSMGASAQKAFGNVGAGLVNGLKTYEKMTQNAINIQKSFANNQKKLDSESTKNYLEGVGDMAGAFKGMMNERSKGYKIMEGIEKAVHALRMGIMVAEFVQGLVNTESAVTNDLITTQSAVTTDSIKASSGVMAGAARMFAQLGWYAFIPVAMMLAVMSGLGFGGGGGAGGAPQIPENMTSDYIQEKQGSGTVLGDPSAKSKTISNGIEILSEHSFEMLDYTQAMLTQLKNIDRNTSNLTDALIKLNGITGITSAFGTQTGTVNESSGISWLFGSSTSTQTDIVDTGLQLIGTIQEFIDMKGILQQYEVVAKTITESDGGFFGIGASSDTHTEISTNIRTIKDKNISKDISGIFKGMFDTIREGVKQLDLFGDQTNSTLESMFKTLGALDISKVIEQGKISLKGLTGDDLKEAVSSVFSKIFDVMIDTALPYLVEFQKIGEGLGETFIRLASDARTVELAFKQAGMTFPTVAEMMLKGFTAGVVDISRVTSDKQKLDDIDNQLSPIKSKLLDDYILRDREKIRANTGLDTYIAPNTSPITQAERDAIQKSDAWKTYWEEFTATGKNVLHMSMAGIPDSMIPAQDWTKTINEGYGTRYLELLKERKATELDLNIAMHETGTAHEDYAFRLIKLRQHLIDGAGGIESFTEKMDFFTENFLTDAQKLQPVLTSVRSAFADMSSDRGDGLPGLGKQIDTLNKQFPELNLKIPQTRKEFATMMQTLGSSFATTGEAGTDLFNSLLTIAPAFDAVASAMEDVINTVAEIHNRIADMKFSMEYDTKDNPGKYAMLDAKANIYWTKLTEKNTDGTYAMDFADSATMVNKLLDQVNTAWGLLTDEQKKTALPEYQNKLDKIDTYIQERGIETLTEMSPDGVHTVDAIQNSTAAIVEAILQADPTAVLDKYFTKTTDKAQSDAASYIFMDEVNALNTAINNLPMTISDATDSATQTAADIAVKTALEDSTGVKQLMEDMVESGITLSPEAIEVINNLNQVSMDRFTAALQNTPANLALTPSEVQADINEKGGQISDVAAKQAEAQTQAAQAINNLADNTLLLEQVISTLQTLATTLVAAAKTPVRVDVDVNVDTPATAEVGIG